MSNTTGSKNVINTDAEIKGNLKFSGELTFQATPPPLRAPQSPPTSGHRCSLSILAPGFATALALVSPATAATLWSQYGCNAAHTSFNNSESVINPRNVSVLTTRWAGVVGDGPASAPIVGQGIVYAASGGNITALNAANGALVWSHPSCSADRTAQAALGAFGLFVGDGGGDLAAYDPLTGAQWWCRDKGGSITAAPAVDGDTVYVSNGSDLIAVNQHTGDQRWRFTPSPYNPLTTTPAIAGGVVYATGGNGVFAVRQSTGKMIWRRDLGPQSNLSAASVSGDTVYVGGNGLFALRTSDGRSRWTSTAAGVNVSTPAIAGGKLFVNSQDPRFGLWAFDAKNGKVLWRSPMPGESLSTVTVANGVVFDVAERDGTLMMFEANTGAFLGAKADPAGHPFSAYFGSQAAVADGVVYVSTGDFFSAPNRVVAFRLP